LEKEVINLDVRPRAVSITQGVTQIGLSTQIVVLVHLQLDFDIFKGKHELCSPAQNLPP